MSNTTNFDYDVFLSHNSQDKPRVRRLAERLRVWFDEWVIQPGDDIYLAIGAWAGSFTGIGASMNQIFI